MFRRPRRDHGRGGRKRHLGLLLVAATLVVSFAGSAGAALVVTGKHIKNGTVAGADVRNGTLKGVDVRAGSLSDADFATPVQGAAGRPGPTGERGTPGVSGLEYVFAPVSLAPNGSTTPAFVECPGSKILLGGGFSSSDDQHLAIDDSRPEPELWFVRVKNTGPDTLDGYVWAVCSRRAS